MVFRKSLKSLHSGVCLPAVIVLRTIGARRHRRAAAAPAALTSLESGAPPASRDTGFPETPGIATAERLRAAADVLERQNDAGVRAVGIGRKTYLAGDAASLDEALALRPEAGHRRASTTACIAERDALLRRAADEFFPGPNTSHQLRELATCPAAPAP